jgi:TctA family transporter
MTFKVYCFLLAKYGINQTKHLPTFRFSKKQILEGIGYKKSQVNLYKIQEILDLLEQLELIKYNHTPHYVEGANGRYMELY